MDRARRWGVDEEKVVEEVKDRGYSRDVEKYPAQRFEEVVEQTGTTPAAETKPYGEVEGAFPLGT